MVLINTGTIGKLNQSTVVPSLFNESSDFHTVFFRAWHKSKRMEKNRCILLFSRTISHFQRQFYKIPGQFQDKWHYFEIPGVFQDQGQIQGLFQVCATLEGMQIRKHVDANRNAPKSICPPPIRLGNEFLCTEGDGINVKIYRGMITVKSLLKKNLIQVEKYV